MEKIKEKIKQIFLVMGFKEPEIDVKKDNSNKDRELLIFNLKIGEKDGEWFLAESATGLSALQHTIKIMLFKEGVGRLFFLIDINNYRRKREEEIIGEAMKVVQLVRRTKKPASLEPMPAYERRLIHLKLAEQPDIITESEGEEPERKVVVRLYP